MAKYFYGNQVSEEGERKGFVDYRTFAKAFDHVYAGDIIEKTSKIGYWELVNGDFCYYEDSKGNIYSEEEREEKIEKLESRQAELEEIEELTEEQQAELDAINEDLERLDDELYNEIFQYFIVSDNAVALLEEAGEIVYYNEDLDLYVWGVCHYGTSWDYVMTSIEC